MYRITLHLGAHKTATSHFRALLSGNQTLLDKHDVVAPDALTIRREITQLLPTMAPGTPLPARPKTLLNRLSQGHANLYMLDENIIGTPVSLFGNGRIYPRAAIRLGRALRLLDGAEIRVFLSIRNPVGFVRASYLETVRNNGFSAFDEYLARTPLEGLRWLPLLKDLRKCAPGLPIHVWRYEDYAALTPQLVALALDTPHLSDTEIIPLAEIIRPGLSARALEEMQKTGVRKSDPGGSYRIKRIYEAYPKSANYPAPEVWSDSEKEALNAGYTRDMEAIRAMENVDFLSA